MDCQLSGLFVPNLADQNNVTVLPEIGAKQAGKRQPDVGVDLCLVDPRKTAFNRILDRLDVARLIVQIIDSGIERSGLTASSRTTVKNEAMRSYEDRFVSL